MVADGILLRERRQYGQRSRIEALHHVRSLRGMVAHKRVILYESLHHWPRNLSFGVAENLGIDVQEFVPRIWIEVVNRPRVTANPNRRAISRRGVGFVAVQSVDFVVVSFEKAEHVVERTVFEHENDEVVKR